METVDNLYLIQPTPEYAKRTCGPYWYLIHRGGSSFTAFKTESAFLQWLNERGLKLTRPLLSRGGHDCQPIVGKYNRDMTMDSDAFYRLQDLGALETRIMSNGDYTLGLLTTDGNGTVTEHYLNVNVRNRPVFDHRSTDAIYG